MGKINGHNGWRIGGRLGRGRAARCTREQTPVRGRVARLGEVDWRQINLQEKKKVKNKTKIKINEDRGGKQNARVHW